MPQIDKVPGVAVAFGGGVLVGVVSDLGAGVDVATEEVDVGTDGTGVAVDLGGDGTAVDVGDDSTASGPTQATSSNAVKTKRACKRKSILMGQIILRSAIMSNPSSQPHSMLIPALLNLPELEFDNFDYKGPLIDSHFHIPHLPPGPPGLPPDRFVYLQLLSRTELAIAFGEGGCSQKLSQEYHTCYR